ncbi:hypothetical protein QTP88_005661 [Uroleucon formosanum]
MVVDKNLPTSSIKAIKLTLLDDNKYWENVSKIISLLTPIVQLGTVHLAAELLDLKTQGYKLNSNERIDALEFIYELGISMGINVMEDLSNYQSKNEKFAKKFIWENSLLSEPLKWWQFLNHISPLSKVALRILSAPCTSTATERTFSTFSWIHNRREIN